MKESNDSQLRTGNSLRPYNNGTTTHKDVLSTIILYTKEKVTRTGVQFSTNELLSLKKTVSVIEPVKNSKVKPSNNPDGYITDLQLSAGAQYYSIFNNFSLLNVIESSSQVTQVVQSFGPDWHGFFYGSSPSIYSFSGVFIDTVEYPYFQEFMVAYDNYLAGTKCIENKMKMKVVYDGRVVDGYMTAIKTATTAVSSREKEFTFSVLVTGRSWIRYNKVYGSVDPAETKLNYLSNIHRAGAANIADVSIVSKSPNV